MYRIFSMIVIAILLGGCVANLPKRSPYPSYTGADAACIQSTKNGKWFSGESDVRIGSIDSIPIDIYEKYQYQCLSVAPGKHRITGLLQAFNHVALYIAEFDLKAGRRYHLHAEHDHSVMRGDTHFKLEFFDITSEPKITIKEFELVGVDGRKTDKYGRKIELRPETYHLSD